jgi:hypothetical protein
MSDVNYSRVHVVGLGVALGVTWALGVFVMGLAAHWGHYGVEMVTFLGHVYVGYVPGVVGAVVGAVWAFVDMFITGVIIGVVYNKVTHCVCNKT